MVRAGRPSERLRQPQPLLRRRVPSGRGALTLWFCVALLLTGVGAGLLGAV